MGQRVHYGWIVAAITFVVLMVGAGVRATPGVLIVPLQREFGWSTATISLSIAVTIFLYGLCGPFAAAIFERFGLRRSVCGALLILAIGVTATTRMEEPWQMTGLWGVLVGAGTGMIAMVFGATVANRWFVKSRGLVLGMLTASSATGQLVFLPLLASISTTYGWRTVAYVVAAASLLLIPFAALLLRNHPADLGLPRYGEIEIHHPAVSRVNPARRALIALGVGVRSKDFWLLSGTFFICGASTNGLVGTHLIPLCVDFGYTEVVGASLLAAMGVFDMIGTTASGWLSDRYDSRKLLAWYYGLRGLSLMFVPFAFGYDTLGLSVFAVFYGLDWIATVPPTVRLAGKSFGEDNAALMFGWIAVAHQIGAAFAAWTAGFIRTAYGDYFTAFFGAGVLCLLAVVMALSIGRRPEPRPSLQAA
jgi:predicted MFS family arabinose efflux permease